MIKLSPYSGFVLTYGVDCSGNINPHVSIRIAFADIVFYIQIVNPYRQGGKFGYTIQPGHGMIKECFSGKHLGKGF